MGHAAAAAGARFSLIMTTHARGHLPHYCEPNQIHQRHNNSITPAASATVNIYFTSVAYCSFLATISFYEVYMSE